MASADTTMQATRRPLRVQRQTSQGRGAWNRERELRDAGRASHVGNQDEQGRRQLQVHDEAEADIVAGRIGDIRERHDTQTRRRRSSATKRESRMPDLHRGTVGPQGVPAAAAGRTRRRTAPHLPGPARQERGGRPCLSGRKGRVRPRRPRRRPWDRPARGDVLLRHQFRSADRRPR